ncbi:MAG: glycine-rich domain-containing protein [Rhizomicrobium sp.]
MLKGPSDKSADAKAGCIMLSEKAGCIMLSNAPREDAVAGCIMLQEKAGCIMLSDSAGCIMLSEKASEEIKAGCIMLSEKAGCIMLSEKAGCIMLSGKASEEVKAGCIMLTEKAGCIMLSETAGCIMLSETKASAEAGCIMLSEKAGCIMLSGTAGCIMLADKAQGRAIDETRLPAAAQYFARVSAWDMSLVKKHLVNKGIFKADEIDQVHEEYKRFVALSCAHDDGAIPVSLRVDEFWHAHILFTQDYAKFCQAVAGRFVHHLPTVAE